MKKRVKEQAQKKRTVYVFDFDDTLVKTDSVIRVKPAKGKQFILTPGEFAVYDEEPGDEFDYSDFEKLINPREIAWTNELLRKAVSEHGKKNVIVLSARTNDAPIHEFLINVELHGIRVVALGNANPSSKSVWISSLIANGNIAEVVFYDDAYRNVAAVKALQKRNPNTKITAHHVPHIPSK